MMTFTEIPKAMAVELAKTVPMYVVNAFSLKSGVLEYLSLMTLVEGVKLEFNKHF